jgi:poly(3-hydroxybutyrate) depolymerase
MSGQDMCNITQYATLAESEGIALVFPDGEGGGSSLTSPWNVANSGQTVSGNGAFVNATGDDFGFMDEMKTTVSQFQCLDAKHTFATGFSMGGYFSHHIGCYRSDIKAVGPASGGTINNLSVCTTGHVPAIIFHGTADGLISPSCDDPHAPAAGAATETGYTASATLWAKKNGCQNTY